MADRSRGETRYEVRRTGRKVRLKRNRQPLHRPPASSRRRATATRSRPCRRKRCAKVAARDGADARARRRDPAAARRRRRRPAADAFAGSPTIGGCPIFPNDNPWNTDVSQAPVDTSHDYIGSLGSMTLWPDFGGDGAYGIPYVSVPFTQPLVPISFEVADESDPGPYPMPLDAPVEGGGDRHVLTLRQGDCKLFELYAAEREGSGWHAYSGAVWDLRSNALRPERWTSADAAGLPILPGLARRDEADSGVIRHALRITVPTTQKAYIHPATHWASSNTDPDQPPMGLRRAAEGELRHQRPARPGARDRAGAEDLRRAGGRQRRLAAGVRRRRRRPGLGRRGLNGIKTIPASALEAVQTGPVVRP